MQNRRPAFLGLVDFPDAELIRRSQRGDLAAYEEIFKKYRGRIYNLLYRIVYDESDAADLTQEVFVKVFTMLPSLKAEKAFTSWLRTVATNAALDHLRKRPRGRTESLDEKAVLGDELVVDREIPSWRDSPEKTAETRSVQEVVQQAMRSLPEDHRIVVALHHLEGLDIRETAKTLGVPEGTVKSRLARAREHLKRRLGSLVER